MTDKTVRYCPRCKTPNDADSPKCLSCGEPLPVPSSTVAEVLGKAGASVPETCSVTGCFRPPAFSPNNRGGGPWYCWPCWREAQGVPEQPAKPQTVYDNLGRISALLARRPVAVDRIPGEDDE